ncbi:MAG: cell surface protein SprA, partial [Alphaproteobacteria bacterium]|nr:cell surface protein SprA [Alphaproteobacteria bacterium]
QRAQKYSIFDFDMQMNINLLATIGDKMKLNISNNTKATFDYQNMQKIDYNGKEDEMIKKIEAGNVSFPLKSNLISGVQSLFGIKSQLQFGKLWVTGVISQQKSQRKSLTLQGGAQAQQFTIKADAYEENKNFLLAHYFRDHYNEALENFPKINSQIIVNKVQVWVTNRTGAVTGVRSVLAFQDLAEANPYTPIMKGGTVNTPLNIPIIALAQLSRSVEQRGGDKKPILSDLRESGAIEQDADIVSFIYRPDYYGIVKDDDGNSNHGIGEIIIAKHRNGKTDRVRLRFVPEYARFENLTQAYDNNDSTFDSTFESEANTYTMPSKMSAENGINDFLDNSKKDSPF